MMFKTNNQFNIPFFLTILGLLFLPHLGYSHTTDFDRASMLGGIEHVLFSFEHWAWLALFVTFRLVKNDAFLSPALLSLTLGVLCLLHPLFSPEYGAGFLLAHILLYVGFIGCCLSFKNGLGHRFIGTSC